MIAHKEKIASEIVDGTTQEESEGLLSRIIEK